MCAPLQLKLYCLFIFSCKFFVKNKYQYIYIAIIDFFVIVIYYCIEKMSIFY